MKLNKTVACIGAALFAAAASIAAQPATASPSTAQPASATSGAASHTGLAAVARTVSASAPRSLEARATLTIRGTATPATGIAALVVEVYTGGRWVPLAYVQPDATGSYSYAVGYGFASNATIQLRARVLGTARTTEAVSPTVTVSRYFSMQPRVSAVTAADVRYTYRAGCPIGPASLRKLEMNFINYSGREQRGVLIVRSSKVSSVQAMFQQMFNARFRLHRMDNPNLWYGNDEEMMKADNTSAFNCRPVTGDPSKLSPHSYGTAIDINTVRNPYKAANGRWYPTNGTTWIDRSRRDAGMIFSWSTPTKYVVNNGGRWGGFWYFPDYQHFEL